LKKISRVNAIIISLIVGGVFTAILVKNVNAIGGPKVNMLTMTQHVLPGTEISESDFTTTVMPYNYAKDAVIDPKDAIGKITAYELIPGQPLLKNQISNKPMRAGLYQGEVGVRIAVDAVTYGGAQPGDYVDVLAQISRGNGQPTTISVLYNHIRVVAEYNGQGQIITKATQQTAGTPTLTMGANGSTLPSFVELAVTPAQRDQLLSAGRVILSVNPWDQGLNNPDIQGVSQGNTPTNLPEGPSQPQNGNPSTGTPDATQNQNTPNQPITPSTPPQ